MVNRISILADWLEKQIGDNSINDYSIMEAIGVSNGTFYKIKPKAQALCDERVLKQQKLIEATKTTEIKEAVRNGLKSKIERVLILQSEVDQCLKELYDEETLNYSLIGGSLKQVDKKLTVLEKVKLRQVIRELQSEISKIEGDYAPEKIDHTTKGEGLNVASMPLELRKQILLHARSTAIAEQN